MSSPAQQKYDDPIQILLVEDDSGDVHLTREAFETTACEVAFRIFSTGNRAVAFLTDQPANDALPDLAIVDLNLPGRDGCDVLETIRADPRLTCTPVLVFTSSEADEPCRIFRWRNESSDSGSSRHTFPRPGVALRLRQPSIPFTHYITVHIVWTNP